MRDNNRKKLHILWCNYPEINVVRLLTFLSYTYKYQHVKQNDVFLIHKVKCRVNGLSIIDLKVNWNMYNMRKIMTHW